MTPADERVLQLLQKWQKSLDLHARYADLPEDQYWLVQPWPNHQRPTKWVVDLARQRLADLQNIVKSRLAAGDPSLSEALELMSFLTNLVGSQHVERFVPIAEPERERQLDKSRSAKSAGSTSTATVLKPAPAPKPARSPGTRGKATAKALKPVNDTTVTAVVKDAARLLSWGRDWHELPEAIARIAGRPGVAQVRQILRGQREAIEERAGQQDKS
ncbi:MAG TPA: hypothetical protein VFM30_00035 [Steroidobacteraceae bacterium]|jgi:hypothetical protein|nr:hypothetical protein [Steroidobacteraceae bacterium]